MGNLGNIGNGEGGMEEKQGSGLGEIGVSKTGNSLSNINNNNKSPKISFQQSQSNVTTAQNLQTSNQLQPQFQSQQQPSSQQSPNSQSQPQAQKQPQQQQLELSEPKLHIHRTIETMEHNYIQNQNKKIINKKQKVQKKVKKIISPMTTSLFLRYNKLSSIQGFLSFVEPIFPGLYCNLMWIDLSHNRLVQLSSDLGQIKNLKTLYLHANYLSNFEQLTKIKKCSLLRTLTIHANPLQTYEEFRIIVHSVLPTLKKIDSTLLTKRETQRAEVLMKSMKKFPIIKNARLPPQESENQDQDN